MLSSVLTTVAHMYVISTVTHLAIKMKVSNFKFDS